MLIGKEEEIWLVTKKKANLFCSIKIIPITKDISCPAE